MAPVKVRFLSGGVTLHSCVSFQETDTCASPVSIWVYGIPRTTGGAAKTPRVDLQRRFSGGKNAFTTHLRTTVERDRNTERGHALDRLKSVKLLGCRIRNAISTTLEFDGPIL